MDRRNQVALALGGVSAAFLLTAFLLTVLPGPTVPVALPESALQGTVIEHTATAPSAPRRLTIPRLDIDVPVVDVGMTQEGNMDIPKEGWEVGWFAPGYRPGEPGNAVLAGHLDTRLGPAVFWELERLRPGDPILVEDASGSLVRFRVTRLDVYGANDAPMREIFGASSGSYLRLITCDGTWLAHERRYADRLVVTAELDRNVESTSSLPKKSGNYLGV